MGVLPQKGCGLPRFATTGKTGLLQGTECAPPKLERTEALGFGACVRLARGPEHQLGDL